MARTVGIGLQDFEKIRRNDYFYVDKTDFIREWWKSGDDVTLITRPRRFGKTLNDCYDNIRGIRAFFWFYRGRGECGAG